MPFDEGHVRFIPAFLWSLQIHPEVSHLPSVVSPLNALMRDQMTRWRQCGVSCAAILGRSEMDEGDVKGSGSSVI